MSFRQLIKEKEQGFPQCAYLLHGSDPFLLKETEKSIRETLDKDHQDFGLDMYDIESSSGRSVSLKQILDSLNTFSFFSEKKIVLVQNIQKLKKAELSVLQDYLANPSDASTLFLFFNDTLKANRKASFSTCTIISLDLNQRELKSWLSSYAQERGITLTPRVIEYLIVLVGNDAGLLSSEVNKLSLLGRRKIETKDLHNIIYGEAGVDTFELTRAISSGDRTKAFRLAKELRTVESNMLLGAINWQLSRNRTRRSSLEMFRYYQTLLEADTINKSTGTSYPLEILITKLLSR